MPNLDNLMEQLAEVTNSNKEGTVTFTPLDMQQVYCQTEFRPNTANL